MATTIGKLSVQVGLDSKGLDAGVDKSSAKLGQLDNSAKGVGKSGSTGMEETKKAAKGIEAGTIAKIGLVAGGGELLKSLVEGNVALEKMLDITRTIGLGWAVGGPIGAGIGLLVGGAKALSDVGLDSQFSPRKAAFILGGKFGMGGPDLQDWKKAEKANERRAEAAKAVAKDAAELELGLASVGKSSADQFREKLIALAGGAKYLGQLTTLTLKFKQLQEKREELQVGDTFESSAKGLADMNQKLGQSADEIQFLTLAQMRFGEDGKKSFSLEQLKEFRKIINEMAVRRVDIALVADMGKIGKTADLVAYEEKLKGMTLAQKLWHTAIVETNDALGREAEAADATKKWLDDVEDRMGKIADKAKSPFDKFQESVDQLQIDLDAMGKTGEERAGLMAAGLMQAANAAGILGDKVTDIPGLESAQAGSATALHALISAGNRFDPAARSGTDLKGALEKLKANGEKQLKAQQDLLAEWKKMNPGNVD